MNSNKPIMKAFGYTLLLSLLIIPHVNVGQDFDKKMAEYKANKFIQEFSIVAGPSINFLRGNNAVDNNFENERKVLVGYSFGLQVGTKQLFKNFNLIAGLMYERKGGKSNSTTTYFDVDDQVSKKGLIELRYKYDYYTLPVRVQYAFDQGNKILIGFGGYVSYLNKQVTEKDDMFGNFYKRSFNETDFNTTMDYGLSLAIKYNIPVSDSFTLRVELVNNLGIRNTRPDFDPGQEMKSNSTVLLMGLSF